jgi:hypothetical protein
VGHMQWPAAVIPAMWSLHGLGWLAEGSCRALGERGVPAEQCGDAVMPCDR